MLRFLLLFSFALLIAGTSMVTAQMVATGGRMLSGAPTIIVGTNPQPPNQFTGINMSNLTFTAGSTTAVGTASATVNAGPNSPSWSIKNFGVDSFTGATCLNYGTDFTINSSTGVVTPNAGDAAGSYNGTCVQATQAGLANSPYSHAFTLVGNNNSNTCDIGPPYTAIPAGAQAAGTTHCAANYDFTSTVSFNNGVGGGSGYNFSNISTWLAGCGASNSTGLWSNVNGYFPGPTPCSDFDIENDAVSSTNVLHIVWTPTDAANGQEMSWLTSATTAWNGSLHAVVGGTTFPPGVYTEIKWRTNQATQNALNDSQPQISYFSCGDDEHPGVEWDLLEQYHDGGAGFTVHDPCAAASPFAATYWSGTNPAPSVGAYHTLGAVISSNGTTLMGAAVYKDGTKFSSNSWNAANSGDYAGRELWGVGLGDQNVSPPHTPTNNMDMYIQHIQFWVLPSCASTWQTGQCNGSIFQ